MRPAVYLTKEETKKVKDKSSIVYKALIATLKQLLDKTGVRFSVIGTDENGNLFEMDFEG